MENAEFLRYCSLYYSHKKDMIKDYNMRIFLGDSRTKELKEKLKSMLKENPYLKTMKCWGGF